MRKRPESEREIRVLEGILAGLTLDAELIRLRRRLLRSKGWETQPRAPAGQTDGGRWVGGGSGGQWASLRQDAPPARGDAPPAADTESTTLEDGTRVLSIRIRAGRKDFDAQHAVIAPDGESRIFETSGATQTIRDGETGEVLSRATFAGATPVPDATVQPAFLPAVPLAIEGALAALQAARTFELALSLFAALSARRDGFGTVLGLTAHEFRPGDQTSGGLMPWVGQLDQQGLDAACPRNGQVQAITNDVARSVRASGIYRNATDFGNKVHILIAQWVKAQHDPDFTAEILMNPQGGNLNPREQGNVRLDLLENIKASQTVCIYDYKTGKADLSMARAQRLVTAALKKNPFLRRIIMIQVRPEP